MKVFLSIMSAVLISFMVNGVNAQSITQPSSGEESKILIVYFSQVGNVDYPQGIDGMSSASLNIKNGRLTGNLELLAKWTQQQTGGDLYLIQTAKKYPVDYNDLLDYAKKEQQANARPKLISEKIDMDRYDTIFIGYPIWWYDLPMVIYGFLESYDFNGKKVIPFSCHGGSGELDTVQIISKLARGAIMGESYSVSRNRVNRAEKDVRKWLRKTGFAQ